MDLKVKTRFTVASDAGIGALLYLTDTISREKFSELIAATDLEKYISEQFNEKKLINDLNDMMAQQWLIVYADEYPAGYAKITSKGKKPQIGNKSAIRIAEFGVLKKYDDPLVWSSLYEKCLMVCGFYDVIWLCEYAGNPAIDYFQKMDFKRSDSLENSFELDLPSVYMVKEKPRELVNF